MTFEQAKMALNRCARSELRDHAFGGAEVYWTKDGKDVGIGYFGDGSSIVDLTSGPSFTGREARELRSCGTTGSIERNDMTGPDEYSEGSCMPGLTLEGVKKELVGQ